MNLPPSRPTEADIAALQETLLAELARGGPPDAILARLTARPACAPFRSWLASWDPALLATAAELVARWGRTAAADGPSKA